jgi:hypothetical protein
VLPDSHRAAVEAVCDRLDRAPLRWAIGGSAALALQAVPVACRDLDLVTEARDVAEVTRRLGGRLLTPPAFVTRERLRGRFARLQLAGVEVEVLGGIQNLLPDGTWSASPQFDVHVARVRCGERTCPVFSLSYLRDAYVAMDRPQTVALIEQALRER